MNSTGALLFKLTLLLKSAAGFVCYIKPHSSSLAGASHLLVKEPNEWMVRKSSSSDDTDNDGKELPDEITEEIEKLQQQLTYIEALEERNKAQLDSFVDEQDQWDSMEEDERQLLLRKVDIQTRLEQMTSELVSMWMGGKSMEG